MTNMESMVRSLVEQVRANLRDQILSGVLPLGERIFENEIAEELRVSRGPVREALRLLEQEGLVVRHPHRGLFVASPDGEEIVQVSSLRGLLESYAVRWSSTPLQDIAPELQRLCDRMKTSVEDSNCLSVVRADLEFHRLIASQTDNAVLWKAFSDLDGHIAIFFHSLARHVPKALDATEQRHRVIADAIRGGDREVIAGVIQEHYNSASSMLLQHSPRSRGGISLLPLPATAAGLD